MRTVNMRTVKYDTPHQFIIPKEKRNELEKKVAEFVFLKKTTFKDYSKYVCTLYNQYLYEAFQNRPKLPQEKTQIFNKISEIFCELPSYFLDKEDLIDVLYNVLLNTDHLPLSIISEEKIDEIRILLKNYIPPTAKEYYNILRQKDFDFEEYLEHICKKILSL